jgi:hypothetical protein
MKHQSRPGAVLWLTLSLFLLPTPLLWAQETSAPAPAEKQQPFVFSPDTVIYVSDFELDAQNFQADEGRTKIVQRPGLIEGPRQRAHDPATQAKKMVDLMSASIVSDLKKAGYKAERLPGTETQPPTGVWVHGVFTELDEGNRIHRAVIGFGSGEAKMQLYVTMNDLSHRGQPLYSTTEGGDSGKKPGAAITLNPYAAAAKFVMEKNAPEKAVKKTASEISKDIVQHLKEHEAAMASK